jgi:hypothetical protein
MRLRDRIPFLGILLLLLFTAWLYVPSLGFGFIWDDPVWLGRLVGRPLWKLLTPLPDYQFYRPGTLLYHRLFLGPTGTFDAPLMHAAQIAFHLINISLTYALSRRLGLTKWTSTATAALMALYPFSHQAVAWAAAHQPLAAALQNATLLTYILARRRRRGQVAGGLSLLLFVAALAVHESTLPLAFLPLLIEWVIHRQRPITRLTVAYLLAAAGFALLWLLTPRQANVASLHIDMRVLGYFAQGLVFPLLGRPWGYEPSQSPSPALVLVLAAATLIALVAAAWRTDRAPSALVGASWALLGIAPVALGLEYNYVSLGSRLFYHAGPGIAILWACALLPPVGRALRRRLWRAVGATLLCLILVQSCLLLAGFDRIYAIGAQHIDQLIEVAQNKSERLLFVNFPDRYTTRREPYPIGYWGLTLAPVSVDLGAFPAIVTGQHPQTESRSMPWIDADARDASLYVTDLRGLTVQADELYRLAQEMDAVYLSRYHADATLELEWAGATGAGATSNCPIAVFGHTLCLAGVEIGEHPAYLDITLTWLGLGSAEPHDTVFVHVGRPGQPPIAQADGDVWMNMLPLTTIQAGDTILDHRIVPLPEEMAPGPYRIAVGVYNRLTGQRLPASAPDGSLLPDDATIVGYLP